MCDELLLVFRTTQTPGAFCLPRLLLTDAQAGSCGGAKPGVSSSRTGQRTLFKFKSLVQKAAQRRSCSRVCPGAIAGEITNERKSLLTHQQLEISAPLRARAILSQREAASGELSDGDGFGIPATPITSPRRRCLPQPVSPVLDQRAQAAKGNVAHSLLADAPSFSITCSPIPITRRGSQEEMPPKSAESCCTVWSGQEEMLSLAYTHHPGLSYLPRAGSVLI